MDILYIILGVVLLYVGGEWVLTGALSTAGKLNIPKVFSAVVIVGLGTSLPELFVGINAMIAGQADVALGNVLGSNVANIGLIAGLGFALSPIAKRIKYVGIECAFFLGSSILLMLLTVLVGGIYGFMPWVMLGILSVYFVFSGLRSTRVEDEQENYKLSTLRTIVYILSGLIALVVGSENLVFGAVNMAMSFGISQAVIGLSIVAIGTSLPELATTIVAIRRKQSEMIIGNILGSNIFNTLLILGVISSIDILDLSYDVFGSDVIFGLVLSIAFVAVFALNKLNRISGLLFLATYSFYVFSWVGR